MARRRLPRGAAADLDTQVLLSGEVAFDTETGVPLFGDGVTPGGRRLRGRERYHVFDVIPARHHTALLNGSSNVDVSAWLQEALDEEGADIEFAGFLRASGLVQTQDGQTLYWPGRGHIMKNANGVILTIEGDDVECRGLRVRGEAAAPVFTGDNILATGQSPSFLNCMSMWAKGRALKATGNAVLIQGRRGIYQTTDATADGYDIEIGQNGVATLYHVVQGYRSSQAIGGIKFVGTGSHSLTDSQFGKLKIDAGGNPGGSNGGMNSSNRILGNVSVGLPSAVFGLNQFSAVTFTFEAGTSGGVLDASNSFANGFALVNNGNGAQAMVRSVGSAGQIVHRYGADASFSEMGVLGDDGFYTPQSFRVGNNKAVRSRNGADNDDLNLASASGANNTTFGHGGGSTNATLMAGAGGVYLAAAFESVVQAADDVFRPVADNTVNFGGASNRIKELFAANATINTSDETLKQDIAAVDDAVLDAWATVKFAQYRWIDSVAAKGDDARLHYGVIAQRLVEAFETAGLDPWAYGLICRDEWAEHQLLERVEQIPAVQDADGVTVTEAQTIEHYRTVPAGSRMGVRYEQALVLEAALMRRTTERLQAQITALGEPG